MSVANDNASAVFLNSSIFLERTLEHMSKMSPHLRFSIARVALAPQVGLTPSAHAQ